MKFALKTIVAATAFAAVGLASAANVTVQAGSVYNGLSFSGSGTLSFSQELLDALNTGGVSVAAYGGAAATTQGSVGAYTAAGASAKISALTINGNSVVGAQTVGGATQTAVANTVSSGGSLTVTDLNVDIANKKVYATIIGGNGVGTLNNFELWDIMGTPQYAADGSFLSYDSSTAVVGPTTISGAGTYTTQLNGLQITTSGFNTFVKALGLKSLGKSALAGVDNFGTITSTITATSAVPEPSTYALMGLGLVGVGLVARRRQAK